MKPWRGLLAGALRLDLMPGWAWLALTGAALAPTWLWMLRRMLDGSDDPLGLLSLAALVALAGSARRELRLEAELFWLHATLLLTLLATVMRGGFGVLPPLPPLLAAVPAVLAVACALRACLPMRIAALPVALLALLSLPLLSSLQFYAGYPLRVVAAEASRWLLWPGFGEVQREGSSLWVDGRLVIVDAPCSGVQMVWLGYFTACVVALWARHPNGLLLRRLPLVGLCVLAGNIVRNSVLVAFEGAGQPLSEAAHGAVGLGVLAAVCLVVAWRVSRPADGGSWFHRPEGGRHARWG